MISQANPGIETVWKMTVGFVGGVFYNTRKGGLDVSSLYTYSLLAALFPRRLMTIILNSSRLGGGFSNFLSFREFIPQSEREDQRQSFSRIGATSLDAGEEKPLPVAPKYWESSY